MVWKGFPTFPAHLRMRPVSHRWDATKARGLVQGPLTLAEQLGGQQGFPQGHGAYWVLEPQLRTDG